MSELKTRPPRPGFLLLLLLLVAGCRAAPPLPAQPSPGAGTPTSGPINLVLWHSETGSARAELEGLARDFHTAYPDLSVTPVYVGAEGDLEKQVTAAIALGRTPDLVLATRSAVAQFARQDGLLTLGTLRDDPSLGLTAKDQADLFPGVLAEGTFAEFHNQLYAFPFDLEAVVLFYNSELVPQPPATWSEFSDMASQGTQDQQFGWAMNLRADIFSAMLVSVGSAMIDDPERRTLFGERGGLAAMTMASQLSKAGAAHVEEGSESLVEGHALFYFGWLSELSDLEQAQKRAGTNFTIGVTDIPQSDPADPHLLVRGEDLAILQVSPARARNAWFFIRWLTASQQTARWARAANAIPLRSSALSFLIRDLPTNARLRQIATGFHGTVPTLVPLSANRHAPQIENVMQDAWSQIVLGKADAAGTLTAASASADQLLTENP